MSHNVLVTGIGGVVGQGILRNILSCRYDIRLIGTNTEKISAGNHLCDEVYQVPFAYEQNYIERLTTICHDENIDLIIPSTDYEAYYLATFRHVLPAVAGSPADVARICLDKYLTWQEFNRHAIPFAECSLPSDYSGGFTSCIVKPRKGRGSRDLHFNPENLGTFSDEYVIQHLYLGSEITTGFYVTRDGELLGHITFVRTLAAGATDSCSVTTEHDSELERIIRKMMTSFTIRGACNIQSIVTSDKRVIPFEINCRISGTNSIRAQFGFTDVKYTIDEILYQKKLTKPHITKGSAVRILLDVIYPDIGLEDIRNNQTSHYLF
jgi:carbamoyl-phosphate synthase large subunit